MVLIRKDNYDNENKLLSVDYSDADGNLPWFRAAQICNTPSNGGNCFTQINMIPNAHTYEDGVLFSAEITQNIVDQYSMSGDYEAHFWFADDDIENYPSAQIELPITIGEGCALTGDLNGDNITNVLDVVLLVNLVLGDGSAEGCSDVNGDGLLNVLDVVLLVNIVIN